MGFNSGFKGLKRRVLFFPPSYTVSQSRQCVVMPFVRVGEVMRLLVAAVRYAPFNRWVSASSNSCHQMAILPATLPSICSRSSQPPTRAVATSMCTVSVTLNGPPVTFQATILHAKYFIQTYVLKKKYKYSFCLMVEASDHVYVWPQTYTCHTYSFTYRLYFLPANPCDTVRHIHDPMLVP